MRGFSFELFRSALQPWDLLVPKYLKSEQQNRHYYYFFNVGRLNGDTARNYQDKVTSTRWVIRLESVT